VSPTLQAIRTVQQEQKQERLRRQGKSLL